ncbi:MAG: AraC family transcriptional regulator [Oscillospiraceae bacterium]|nr:AraC family transcriptional regulator [Oscillospiraceae bacterium]MCL2280006.1 AraC family transcriptional regulator [Oscillospiraceae bacterium]
MPDQIMHIFPHINFTDLTMFQFGKHICDPFYSRGPYVHNHYLFHYVKSGKGHLYSENAEGRIIRHSAGPGQGFMIWPKQVVSYAADGDNPWSYYWVEFDGFKARDLVAESGLTFDQPIYSSENRDIQNKMVDAMRHLADNGEASPFELIGYCYLFLDAFVASSKYRKKTAQSSLQNFYVQEILLFIENHYHEEIGVEDIAAVCNLDRSHVGKIFKSLMGINLRDFLIRYRIRKACELMKEPSKSISEISVMVGYPNLFSFSRTFKAIVGQSPRQWRSENKWR